MNLAFRRLQPKITTFQKVKQGTNNEGKWKVERAKVSTSEAMVDHAQITSRGERVSKNKLKRRKHRQQLDPFHLLRIVSY